MSIKRRAIPALRSLAFACALFSTVTVAPAQDAVPDLKGTWSGRGKSVIFGHNPHHPGSQTVASPPRVRDFEFTLVVSGQEGRLAWGYSSSSAAVTNEPFALAIADDNKSIMGSDNDGHIKATIMSPDRIEMCYAHSGVTSNGSIVASCFVIERLKK